MLIQFVVSGLYGSDLNVRDDIRSAGMRVLERTDNPGTANFSMYSTLKLLGFASSAQPTGFCASLRAAGLHHFVLGAAAAFGGGPGDVLGGVFDVAGFAVNAVAAVNL